MLIIVKKKSWNEDGSLACRLLNPSFAAGRSIAVLYILIALADIIYINLVGI